MYLFEELNASLQIHTKINKDPINAFSFVLVLFENEHVMVEELLQLLVAEVDANLLKTIELLEMWQISILLFTNQYTILFAILFLANYRVVGRETMNGVGPNKYGYFFFFEKLGFGLKEILIYLLGKLKGNVREWRWENMI